MKKLIELYYRIFSKWSEWVLYDKGVSYKDSVLVFKESFEIYVSENQRGLKRYKKVIINPNFY